MVVHVLLLVRDVDGDQVCVLDVTHLDLVLLECISRLVLAMVKSAVDLLAAVLDLLTHTVVFALCLAQLGELSIPLLFELRSVVAMELAELFSPCCQRLQGIGKLCYEGGRELVMFGCPLLEGVELNSPCGHGRAVRSRQHTLLALNV